MTQPTPARYLIDNPTNDIFQIPKFWSLDHDAGYIYICDDIYNTPNGLSPYRTEKV